MFIKDLYKCKELIAGDMSRLREWLHPGKDKIDIRYSVAYAIVKPGNITRKHRLKSKEVYLILKGKAIMYINEEAQEVREGHAIYIPSNAVQQIKNIGNEDLKFLCIVDPAWKKEDEEVL